MKMTCKSIRYYLFFGRTIARLCRVVSSRFQGFWLPANIGHRIGEHDIPDGKIQYWRGRNVADVSENYDLNFVFVFFVNFVLVLISGLFLKTQENVRCWIGEQMYRKHDAVSLVRLK